MMCVITANLVKVIVFPGDAQTFLRIDGTGVRALVGAQKDVFKLDTRYSSRHF